MGNFDSNLFDAITKPDNSATNSSNFVTDTPKSKSVTLLSKSDESTFILHFWSRKHNILIPSDIIKLLVLYSTSFEVNFIPTLGKEGNNNHTLEGSMSRGIMTSMCYNMQGYCYKPLKQGIFTWKAKTGIHTSCTKQVGIVTKLRGKRLATYRRDLFFGFGENESNEVKNKKIEEEIIAYYYSGYGSLVKNINGEETVLFKEEETENWYWKNNECICITVKLSKNESFIKFEKEVKKVKKDSYGDYIYESDFDENKQIKNVKTIPKLIHLGNKIEIKYGKEYFIFCEICNRNGNKIYFCQ